MGGAGIDSKAPRGFSTIAHIRARCCVDPSTGCWHWLGGKSSDGVPRIHAFDHERGDKRTMSGPKAVWNIAHGRAPLKGFWIFRHCVVSDCLNPVHLAEARSQADIGKHIARSDRRKGTAVAARRANAVKGWAARGLVLTPPQVVSAIRMAPPEVTGMALAAMHGIRHTTVSNIRRFKSHVAGAI